jgi:hypothetical protein
MKRLAWLVAVLALVTVSAAVVAASGGSDTPSNMRGIDDPRTPNVPPESPAPTPTGGSVAPALGALLARYTQAELATGVYVGSEFCIACHSDKATWRETLHSRFLRRPLTQYSLMPRQGVIADYDHNGVDDFIQGLDFNQINSAFDAYKPNAPMLSVANGKYYVTVGELQCPVTFTQAGQGGTSAQRYVVKIPVTDSPTGLSDSNYFAPLQFVPGTGWVPNSPQNWYDGSNPRWGPGTTLASLAGNAGNYSQTCVGCHSTGIRRVGPNPSGEVSFDGFIAILYDPNDPTLFDYDGDGIFDLMNIGCESCHGSGSAHILGGGDPSKIVNPEKIPVSAQVDICGRCHSQPHSVPNGTYNWPYNDATMTDFTPIQAAQGVPWADFATDASVRWPDGKTGHMTRPYHDFLESPKPTFRFGGVSCTDCHDPHEALQEHQIRTSLAEGGVTIPTKVDDNTLCLACHATHGPFADINVQTVAEINRQANHDLVARVVSSHSHHPYAPEREMGLSRCVECHMPTTSGFSTLTSPSHTFEPIGPAKTLEFQDQGGMPNSCSVSCHSYRVNIFDLGIDPNANNSIWNEPFDRALARDLLRYYGPGGIWWNTDAP